MHNVEGIGDHTDLVPGVYEGLYCCHSNQKSTVIFAIKVVIGSEAS